MGVKVNASNLTTGVDSPLSGKRSLIPSLSVITVILATVFFISSFAIKRFQSWRQKDNRVLAVADMHQAQALTNKIPPVHEDEPVTLDTGEQHIQLASPTPTPHLTYVRKVESDNPSFSHTQNENASMKTYGAPGISVSCDHEENQKSTTSQSLHLGKEKTNSDTTNRFPQPSCKNHQEIAEATSLQLLNEKRSKSCSRLLQVDVASLSNFSGARKNSDFPKGSQVRAEATNIQHQHRSLTNSPSLLQLDVSGLPNLNRVRKRSYASKGLLQSHTNQQERAEATSVQQLSKERPHTAPLIQGDTGHSAGLLHHQDRALAPGSMQANKDLLLPPSPACQLGGPELPNQAGSVTTSSSASWEKLIIGISFSLGIVFFVIVILFNMMDSRTYMFQLIMRLGFKYVFECLPMYWLLMVEDCYQLAKRKTKAWLSRYFDMELY